MQLVILAQGIDYFCKCHACNVIDQKVIYREHKVFIRSSKSQNSRPPKKFIKTTITKTKTKTKKPPKPKKKNQKKPKQTKKKTKTKPKTKQKTMHCFYSSLSEIGQMILQQLQKPKVLL